MEVSASTDWVLGYQKGKLNTFKRIGEITAKKLIDLAEQISLTDQQLDKQKIQ